MMNAETLNRFESVAHQVMQPKQDETWGEKKQRVQHLGNLIQNMREGEDGLCSKAESCGNWQLRYAEYLRLDLTETIKNYVRGAKHFTKYEGMTSGDLEQWERERTIEGHWRFEYRTAEEHNMPFECVRRSGEPQPIDHVEKQEYDDRYLGWLRKWKQDKDTLLYRLCRAMGFGGVADEVYDTIRVRYIRGGFTFTEHGKMYDRFVKDEYKPLVEQWYKEQEKIDKAHNILDAAAYQLTIAARFVCLWYALRQEKDSLEYELRLVGELPTSAPVSTTLVPQYPGLEELLAMLSEQPPIKIKGRKGTHRIVEREVDKWKFATKALCAYVGSLLDQNGYTDTPYVVLSGLTGIDNRSISTRGRNVENPTGHDVIDRVFNEWKKSCKKL